MEWRLEGAEWNDSRQDTAAIFAGRLPEGLWRQVRAQIVSGVVPSVTTFAPHTERGNL